MANEILNRFEEKVQEYKEKKENLSAPYSKRIDLANTLIQNYGDLMKLSDNEFKLKSLNSKPSSMGSMSCVDEFYLKLSRLRELVFSRYLGSEVCRYFTNALNDIENRTMKEDEYNYLSNNSHKQILKDKIKEFYPNRGLLKRIDNSIQLKMGLSEKGLK